VPKRASCDLTMYLCQRRRRRRRRDAIGMTLVLVHHPLRTGSLELLHPVEHFVSRQRTARFWFRFCCRGHSGRLGISRVVSGPSSADHTPVRGGTRPGVPVRPSPVVPPPLLSVARRSGLNRFLADSFQRPRVEVHKVLVRVIHDGARRLT